jgi:hypothetical protein
MNKTVIASVLFLILGSVACIGGAIYYGLSYTSSVSDGHLKGAAFGEGKTERACVEEVLRTYDACSVFDRPACRAKGSFFLSACLEASLKGETFCKNMPFRVYSGGRYSSPPPHLVERAEREKVLYLQTLCEEFPDSPESCEFFAPTVFGYCD